MEKTDQSTMRPQLTEEQREKKRKAAYASARARRANRPPSTDRTTGVPSIPPPGLKPMYTLTELARATGMSRHAMRTFLMRHRVPTTPPLDKNAPQKSVVRRIFLADLQLYAPKLVQSLRLCSDHHAQALGLHPRTPR